MQTDNMREKTFNMRLSPEEVTQFEAVAKHYGLPVASMLRMLVKEKARDIDAGPFKKGSRVHVEIPGGLVELGAASDEEITAFYEKKLAEARAIARNPEAWVSTPHMGERTLEDARAITRKTPESWASRACVMQFGRKPKLLASKPAKKSKR